MAKLGEYGDKLPTMTADEVALVASRHLLEQGVKSFNDEGDYCAYDGDGVCCAAAPFINNYDEDMETKGWFALVEDYGQSKLHMSLISSFQAIHDDNLPSAWPSKIRELINGMSGDFPQTMAYLESVT